MEALCRIAHRRAYWGGLPRVRHPLPFLVGRTPHAPTLTPVRAMAAMSTVVDPEEEAKIAARKKKKEKDKARKSGSAPATEAKESTGEKRLGELIHSCLNVPPPRRHIKAKERMREQMLEKYGLLTKERQRELDTEKARQKALQARARGEAVGDEFNEPTGDIGPDEAMHLAKEYSRFMMRHHRQRQIGETLRLKLKLAAIEALPPRLKEAAKVPDLSPFPGTPPAMLTPPIKGYYHRYVRKEEKAPDFSDLS